MRNRLVANNLDSLVVTCDGGLIDYDTNITKMQFYFPVNITREQLKFHENSEIIEKIYHEGFWYVSSNRHFVQFYLETLNNGNYTNLDFPVVSTFFKVDEAGMIELEEHIMTYILEQEFIPGNPDNIKMMTDYLANN